MPTETTATSSPATSSSSPASTGAPTTSSTSSASTPASGSPSATPPSSSQSASTPSGPVDVQKLLADKMLTALDGVSTPAAETTQTTETPDPTQTTEPGDETQTGEGDGTGEEEEQHRATGEGDDDFIDFFPNEEEGAEETGEGEAATDPQSLHAKLKAKPELMAMLNEDPELKDQIFANSRLAGEAAAFKELFNNPEQAKVAYREAETINTIRNGMIGLKGGDIDGTRGVIDRMLEAAALRDDNGEIMKDPTTGQILTDGTTGRFLKNAFQLRLEMLQDNATKAGNDDLLAALDSVMDAEGMRAPSSAEETEDNDLSERERNLVAENKRLNEQREALNRQSVDSYFADVDTRNDRLMDNAINQFVTRMTGIDEYKMPTVLSNVHEALKQQIQNNPLYEADLNMIRRAPMSAVRAKKEVALNAKWLADKLPKIMREEVGRAKGSILSEQKARQDKQAAREKSAQGEVRAAMTPTSQAQQPTGGAEFQKQFYADYEKQHGRKPSIQEYLTAKMTRSLGKTA